MPTNKKEDLKEKVYDFTKDTPGKYLLSNKYLVSLILYGIISKDLGGLSLSEIFDLLPSSEEDDNYVETLSKEFGGFESKLTERDIIFKLDVNISSLNKVLNINLELERSIQRGYDLVNRAMVYACQNLLATTQGKNYDDINKTYSIWICMENHITQKEPVKDESSPLSFIHRYCMGKKDNNSDNITYNKRVDKINLVFIELGELVKNKDKFVELDSENDDIKMLIEYLSILFREQTKSELDTKISELSQEFEGKELTCKGVDGMTSRLYTIAELEEAMIKAEDDARKLEEARIRAEEDARKLEEAMIKAEEENARKLEEARIRAEEDVRKLEEARIRTEEENAHKLEEAMIKSEEENARKLEEAMIKSEEENARKLEEARIRAEEDACKLEEEKLILRLLISGTSIKEISAKQNVTEEYIKSLLEDK